MSNYPMGVKDSDFHMPNAHGAKGRVRVLSAPSTAMVYCPPCMKHWEAPAREDYWNARVELCSEHSKSTVRGVTLGTSDATRATIGVNSSVKQR